ncbi:hypothetical protein GGP85_003025 [Salinibacter ruber]|uniref:hypothetical protein n=1 Tax=Salinibacter ruber TaxID=146919 RepID=UPI0021693A84|nr:hypothetical protein [Salinibacter ruber]MCS3827555.1 hypothetical protein [Salinibacter ruber]
MLYQSPGPPVRSLDVAGTNTLNRRRYTDPNCLLRLNRQGRPVAIRPVKGVGQPGSFACRRYQVIRPNGIVALSRSALIAWMKEDARLVN